jgi:Tol biopolymer transport system component
VRPFLVLCAALAAALAGLARATYPGQDGPLIAFVREAPPCPSGHCKYVIATIHADGRGERHLTKGIIDENPAWSPDGRRIAFVHGFPVSPPPQIEVINAVGGGRRLLVRRRQYLHGGYEGFPRLDWLDNRQIVFENHGGTTSRGRYLELEAVSAGGGPVRRLTRLPLNTTGWAIHGGRIAYVVYPQGLFVGPVRGRRHLLTPGSAAHGHHFTFDMEGGGRIDWSPDGRKILFATNQFVDDTAIADLYAVDSRTGALAKIPGKPWLPYASGVIRGPTWSPGGDKILLDIEYQASGFMAMPSSGGDGSGRWIRGQPGKCLGEACAAVWPRWQPRP